MSILMGLSLGPSFAEACVVKNSKVESRRLFYLPTEPLATHLKKFIEETAPDQIFIDSRHLEKILGTKLGGSVAQLVTNGFDAWLRLRQPILQNGFSLSNVRSESLGTSDLILQVNEKIDAQGKVVKALEINELEELCKKMKAREVTRVCIHFLHSQKNSSHLEQAAKYLREQGFEVFAELSPIEVTDEISTWRKNSLNACLAGTYEELSLELKNILGDNWEKTKFVKNKDHLSSSLWDWTRSLCKLHENQSIIYLGLEQWTSLRPKEKQTEWKSQWGTISTETAKIEKLRLQPTCEIRSNLGLPELSRDEKGYEPGPLSFGRSHVLTMFDILIEKMQTPLSPLSAQKSQRLDNALQIIIKNSKKLENTSVEKLKNDLWNEILFEVETELRFQGLTGPVILTGFFAPLFFKELKNKFPEWNLKLSDEAQYDQALAAISGGQA